MKTGHELGRGMGGLPRTGRFGGILSFNQSHGKIPEMGSLGLNSGTTTEQLLHFFVFFFVRLGVIVIVCILRGFIRIKHN